MPTAHNREKDSMRKNKKNVNITVQAIRDAHPKIFGSAIASAASPARATQQTSVPPAMDHATRGDALLLAACDVGLQRQDGHAGWYPLIHSICAPQGSATTWMLAGTPPLCRGRLRNPSRLHTSRLHQSERLWTSAHHQLQPLLSLRLFSPRPSCCRLCWPATVGDVNFPRATANTNPSFSTLVADKLREGFELLRNGVLPVCCPVTQVPLVRNRLGHILGD